MGALAGLWHDLGKYSEEFQSMITGGDPGAHLEGVTGGPRRVNHSSAGALWAIERFGPRFGRLIAYAIAGHHAGLPDWIGEGDRRGLKDRLAEKLHLTRALAGNPPAEILSAAAPSVGIPGGADAGLWVRMFASALFDADFLDAESFFEPAKGDGRAEWPSLDTLAPRLDDYLAVKAREAIPSAVNRIRAEILAACREAAQRPPGLFSLTVPTGGGKTLSSLAFALAHARRNGLRRVIYAIPFTSIIEQTAGVFRDAVGHDGVLEHHSALGPRPEQETVRSRLAAENWNAPLIVTTTVQLFESLFANRTSHVRKLHNLAGTVLILDEAQALPPAVLRPVTAVLDQLVRYYGVSAVLCTATQPALSAVFHGFSPIEIAPDPPALFKALDRVTLAVAPREEHRSWDEVAAEIAQQRQALAIVNTRRDCRTLHALLPAGTIHLSTWQCAAHRASLLAEVKRRLAAGEELRVASTSLVEAGVDVDFPVVYRAMTGLDSIAQAAGRCNRNGLLGKGRVVVFRPKGARVWGHIAQSIEAAEATLRAHGNTAFSPAAFEHFFRELYWAKGEEALDHYRMGSLLGIGLKRREGDPFDFRFRTAAEKFRMIDEAQETIVVPFDSIAERNIAQLRHVGPNRHLMRQLQPYTVPVVRSSMAKLRETLAVEDLDGVTVLTKPDLYWPDVGLDLAGVTELRPEDLIL